MASLNLAERTLEANLVYIGSGAGELLDGLLASGGVDAKPLASADDAAVIEIRSHRIGKVQGCDVRFHLRLAAADAAAVRDADGLVLSLDGGPGDVCAAERALTQVVDGLPVVVRLATGSSVPTSVAPRAIHIVQDRAEGDVGSLQVFDAIVDGVVEALRSPRRKRREPAAGADQRATPEAAERAKPDEAVEAAPRPPVGSDDTRGGEAAFAQEPQSVGPGPAADGATASPRLEADASVAGLHSVSSPSEGVMVPSSAELPSRVSTTLLPPSIVDHAPVLQGALRAALDAWWAEKEPEQDPHEALRQDLVETVRALAEVRSGRDEDSRQLAEAQAREQDRANRLAHDLERVDDRFRQMLELLADAGRPVDLLRADTAARLEAMEAAQSVRASEVSTAVAELRAHLDEAARASAARMSVVEARIEEGTTSARSGLDDVRRLVRTLESRIAERIGDLERASGSRDARLEQVASSMSDGIEGLRAALERRGEELPALLASALSVSEAQLAALRTDLTGIASSGDAHWVELRDGLPGLLSRAIGPVGEHLRLLRADTQHHAGELPSILARALTTSEEHLKALRTETRKLSLLESGARALQTITTQAAADLQQTIQMMSASMKQEATITRERVQSCSDQVAERVQREVGKMDGSARDEVIRQNLARLLEATSTIEPRLVASLADGGRHVERLAKRLEDVEQTLAGLGEELRKKRGWFS